MRSRRVNNVTYYIGPFPPAYGGVTIKNKNLYHELSNAIDVRKIDLNRVKQGSPRELLRFAWAMLTGKQYVIGVSSFKNRRTVTKFLYQFKRNAMRRSVLVVMGGVIDDVIAEGADFIRMFNTYRRIFVELPGMLEKLKVADVRNVAIYPNGRPRPDVLPRLTTGNKPLKSVFFSIIQPEKGVDLILEAAQKLPHMQFHFYGLRFFL